MSSIPEELHYEILLRLPVKSLLVCKSVCKNWYALISNPTFGNTHLNRNTQRKNLSLQGSNSYDEYVYEYEYAVHPRCYESLLLLSGSDLHNTDDTLFKSGLIFSSTPKTCIELLCSCNGLVCLKFWINNKQRLCLWNPATREYKKLPEEPPISGTSRGFTNFSRRDSFNRCALGYDDKINDYKFVTFVELESWTYQILVYALGSNSWKIIENKISSLSVGARQTGVFVNGSLNWIGLREDSFSKFILSFDINNERSNDIQLPKEALDEERLGSLDVGVLKGCLCLVDRYHDTHQVIVWIMKEYGVRESWTKHCVINLERIVENHKYLRLMSFLKNGEILFGIYGSDNLVIYDPNRRSVEYLHGLNIINGVSYFETLVSLKSGMYVGRNGKVEWTVKRNRQTVEGINSLQLTNQVGSTGTVDTACHIWKTCLLEKQGALSSREF